MASEPTPITTDPDVLAVTVDHMDMAALQATAHAILDSFAFVVESPGAQRREISICRSHPEGSAPTSTPMCSCECPSRRDHWLGLLQSAAQRDATADQPHATRDVVLQAAEDLQHARRGPRDRPDPNGAGESDHWGPERDDFICKRYVGIPARRAARLESRRAGTVDAAGIRRCRSRNGYGVEMGEQRAPDADLFDQALTLSRMGRSIREIAVELDVGKSSIARWLDGLDDGQAVAA
jgi:hypothetical protein